MRRSYCGLLFPTLVIALTVASAAWAQIDQLEGVQSEGPTFGNSSFGEPPGGPLGVPAESVVTVAAQFTAPAADKPGRLFIQATIKPGWHIYSITQVAGGPIRTAIKLDESSGYQLLGDFQAFPPPDKQYEELFGIDVENHRDQVIWHAPIQLAPGVDPAGLKIQGQVYAQPCDATRCLQAQDFPFTAALGPGIELREVFDPEKIETKETVQVKSLLGALAFAFFGGLILNVMPCVLPVIGLKILAFFEQAGKSRTRALVLNAWYSLGILSVFIVLAALGVGLSNMFTAELFGIAMAAVIFVMALSLMGVWQLRVPNFLGSGKTVELAEKEGALGAFFKGIITTLLAIPCGAPLLSPALEWADLQVRNHAPQNVYLAFAVIGIGMASPYLLIGAFPELLRFLPKPGAWMETFEKTMGYLLLAAVVWILYFLPLIDVVPTIGLLFGLWFACWLIGRTPITASGEEKAWAWVLGIAVVGVIGVICFPLLIRPAMQHRLERAIARSIQEGKNQRTSLDPSDENRLPWRPFGRAAFEQLTGAGQTVLIDFTADWCLTCKTLERFVLNTRTMREAVRRNGVVTMQADWTDGAAEVTEMLEILGSRQVPVVAIFPAGDPNHPIVFRGAFTQKNLLEALEEAGPSKPNRAS